MTREEFISKAKRCPYGSCDDCRKDLCGEYAEFGNLYDAFIAPIVAENDRLKSLSRIATVMEITEQRDTYKRALELALKCDAELWNCSEEERMALAQIYYNQAQEEKK